MNSHNIGRVSTILQYLNVFLLGEVDGHEDFAVHSAEALLLLLICEVFKIFSDTHPGLAAQGITIDLLGAFEDVD